MGKLTTYVIIMSGLMLLFHFAGLVVHCDDDAFCENTTPNSVLFNQLIHPENIRTATLTSKIILALEALALVGAAVLSLFYSRIELAVMGGVSIYLLNIFLDFVAVFERVYEVTPVLAILLFAPMMIMFVITIIEWWRGND